MNAHFPRGVGDFVEMFFADFEVVEEEAWELRGGAFADADDADLRAADDADGEMGNFAFEGDGGEESGAACAEDEDGFDHNRFLLVHDCQFAGVESPRVLRKLLSTPRGTRCCCEVERP